MQGSPGKTSTNRGGSPTKSEYEYVATFNVSNSNGYVKHRATSPVRKIVTPFRRSPTKVQNSDVKEQARQVLEKFLSHSLSLSENSAGRGSVLRNYAKDGSCFPKVKEDPNSSTTIDLSSPVDKRSENSTTKNAVKCSLGSISSHKSQLITVNSNEASNNTEQINKKVLGSLLSTKDIDDYELIPNSTGASKSADQHERETSDEEDSVQQGRHKKSKFAKAKARIRDSFLRKQRELASPVSRMLPGASVKQQISLAGDSSKWQQNTKFASRRNTNLEEKAPDINGRNELELHPLQGSTDIDEESPSVAHGHAIIANSSPDGLNRIKQQEKKTKTSFWDWFRPAKRKSKQKDRQKSRSLDALTNYTVHNVEGNQSHCTSHHKKHSFSGRCSFSGKTENGVDRTRLKLSDLLVNRPRTPETNHQKRVFPLDVVTDAAVTVDHVDAESPLEIPFHERTQAEKNEVYDLVACRLADIANNCRLSSSIGDASSPKPVECKESDLSSLERDIAGILRGTGDKHATTNGNEHIEQIMVNAVKTAGYNKFKAELKRQMNSEPDLQQLAWLFDATKGAMQFAGVGGQIAMKVKEYSLKYFEDKFASWIIDRGGWDSMLSDEGDITGDDDEANFD